MIIRALILLTLFIASCKPNQALNNQKDPKSTESTDKSSDADEKVDVPSNIAGSYLTCALRKEAKPEDLDAQYGCQLTDQSTKKKLDLAAAVQRLIWTSNISEGVKITALEASSIYHVYYDVSGSSVEAIQEKAKALEVIANYKLDSGNTVPVKRDRILNVLKPAVELEDYEAPIVREQTIQTDRPGSL